MIIKLDGTKWVDATKVVGVISLSSQPLTRVMLDSGDHIEVQRSADLIVQEINDAQTVSRYRIR